MKLLIISKHLLNLWDAQAQQTHALVFALADAGYKLDVICGETPLEEIHSATSRLDFPQNIKLHSIPASWHTTGQTLIHKIQRKIGRNLSAIFEDSWVKHAAMIASRLQTEGQHDAMISIGLPMDSHFAAEKLRHRLPWIATMSDPWPESIMPRPYSDYSIPMLSHLQRRAVQRVLNSADRIVLPCIEMLDYLRQFYSGLNDNRTAVIPHVAPKISTSRLQNQNLTRRIVHAGSLSRERSSEALAAAMAQIPDDDPLQFHFIGFVHPDMKLHFQKHGVSSRVRITPWMRKQEILSECTEATACLLVEAEMTDYPFLPSKLADYSSCARPILAITGATSPTSRLLRKFSAGLTTTHEKNSIASALKMNGLDSMHGTVQLNKYFNASSIASSYQTLLESLTKLSS